MAPEPLQILIDLNDEPDLQYVALEASMAALTARGVITPLPDTATPAPTQTQVGPETARWATIRNRLFRLGYLPRDQKPIAGTIIELDQEFTNALTQFQNDALLKPDGWVGEKTWAALQNLLAFEQNEFDISNFLIEPDLPCNALVRAAWARLQLFGVAETISLPKPMSELEPALRDFWLLLDTFAKGTTENQIMSILETLMTYEKLSRDLANAHQPASNASRTWSGTADIHAQFIARVMAVELWLGGFDANRGLDITSSTFVSSADYKPHNNFRTALVAFWMHHDEGPSASRMARESIRNYPQFFERVQKNLGTSNNDEKKQQHQDVMNWLMAQPAEIHSLWDRLKGLRSRLWDGLKRAISWAWRTIKKTAHKVKRALLSIARIVHNYALTSWNAFRAALIPFTTAVDFLFDRAWSPPGNGIIVKRSLDADFQIILQTGPPDKNTKLAADYLVLRARAFSASSKILGFVMSAAKFAMKLGTFVGWAALIFALARSGEKIMDFVKDLSDILRDLTAYDGWEWNNG